jgi:hypothetical protein
MRPPTEAFRKPRSFCSDADNYLPGPITTIDLLLCHSLVRPLILFSIFPSRSLYQPVLMRRPPAAPSICPPRRPSWTASRIRPKAFAHAHLRLPGAPKSCSHAGTLPLRSIWQRLPFIKVNRYFNNTGKSFDLSAHSWNEFLLHERCISRSSDPRNKSLANL